jgi:hypothetical protein
MTCAHSRRTFRDRDFLASAIDPKPLPGEAARRRLDEEMRRHADRPSANLPEAREMSRILMADLFSGRAQ